MTEPDPNARAIRRFVDPDYRPLHDNLAGLRAAIDAIDTQLVELVARRAMLVMDATRFKRDAHEAAAPARQAEVYARVRTMAERELARQPAGGFPGLPDVVDATWRTMVAEFVAREQALLARTERVDGDAR